jgi:hypothetical protein
MTRMMIRKLGLWSGVAAILAFGLTVVASDRNLGFGYTISHSNQLVLLAAAITLCLVQVVLYLATQGEKSNAKRNKRP